MLKGHCGSCETFEGGLDTADFEIIELEVLFPVILVLGFCTVVLHIKLHYTSSSYFFQSLSTLKSALEPVDLAERIAQLLRFRLGQFPILLVLEW